MRHGFRDAAQQEVRESRASVRRHHNNVGLNLARDGEDAVGDVGGQSNLGMALVPHVRQFALRQFTQALLGRRLAAWPYALHDVARSRNDRDYVQDMQRRIRRSRELSGVSERHKRILIEVHRAENRPVREPG